MPKTNPIYPKEKRTAARWKQAATVVDHKEHDHTILPNCGLCRIELEDVSVTREGQQLLQNVSMHIHCGQLTALIGQNGAGKTTLIKALLGLIPYSGSIHHMDDHCRPIPHLRTGYVPQHLTFDQDMPVTVKDFLASSMTRKPVWLGVSKKVEDQVRQALDMVEAGDLLSSRLGKLSGGELQRVLLALALTPMPDLLLLDEPVSGVDQNGQMRFLDTVLKLRQTHHIAILLVSHDLTLVNTYADHVVLLDKQVLCQGKPEEVFASDDFRRLFKTPETAREAQA